MNIVKRGGETMGKAAETVAQTAEKAADTAGKAAQKAAEGAGKAADKAAETAGKAAEKAVDTAAAAAAVPTKITSLATDSVKEAMVHAIEKKFDEGATKALQGAVEDPDMPAFVKKLINKLATALTPDVKLEVRRCLDDSPLSVSV